MDVSTEAFENAYLGLDDAEDWFVSYGYPYLIGWVTCPNGMIEARRSISKRGRFRIFARDDFTCQYCGMRAPNAVLVVDHIVPVSRGGRTMTRNLITCCEPCNQGKANREFNVETACYYLKLVADKE